MNSIDGGMSLMKNQAPSGDQSGVCACARALKATLRAGLWAEGHCFQSLRMPIEAVHWGLQLLFIMSAYQKCVS